MARTLIGVLMMSLAAGTGAAQQSLRVGERLPTLKGQFLTGRDAVLPEASAGKVTLIAMGFTYASRVSVEAWADWYRTAIGSRTDITSLTRRVSCAGFITTGSTHFNPTN